MRKVYQCNIFKRVGKFSRRSRKEAPRTVGDLSRFFEGIRVLLFSQMSTRDPKEQGMVFSAIPLSLCTDVTFLPDNLHCKRVIEFKISP